MILMPSDVMFNGTSDKRTLEEFIKKQSVKSYFYVLSLINS